jgi:signal transduction histidine kinase
MSAFQLAVGIFFVTFIIVILGVTATMVMLVATRRRARQDTNFAQERLNYEQELRAIENETREDALSMIAGELHDNIGQLLTTTRLQIEKAKLIRPEIASEIEPISVSLASAIGQVRLLSHALHSDLAGSAGLLKALTSEVVRLQSLGSHQIEFIHGNEEPQLTPDQHKVAFRIAQEVINNALRHADATEILITINSPKSPGPILSISDNGKGFDKIQAKQKGGGLGLLNMEKPAALAQLDLSIQSTPGKGSSFTLSTR